jgi:hypothetical protein
LIWSKNTNAQNVERIHGQHLKYALDVSNSNHAKYATIQPSLRIPFADTVKRERKQRGLKNEQIKFCKDMCLV